MDAPVGIVVKKAGLEGDLSEILSLASGKQKPAHPENERVPTLLVAGVRSRRCRQGLFQAVA